MKEYLQCLIEELELSKEVTLLGYRSDIRSLLYGADLFVFPSKQEGMPVALMEAMAAGTDVAASDIRGNRELLAVSEQGLLDYDSNNIRKKMKQIYETI